MTRRYLWLHLRDAVRLVDVFFWPLMELLVWGFLATYLRRKVPSGGPGLLPAILYGMVFWDVLYRAQQSVSLALMEEMWTRNVLNLLVTPLRTWEWVVASWVYGFMKATVVGVFLLAAAAGLYSLDLSPVGFHLLPFFLNLMLMGWAVGLVTASMLLYWGHAAEALIWGVPVLLQPLSAVFYPLSVYPAWLKPACLALPSTYVMEGMRAVVAGGAFPWGLFWGALLMNAVYLTAASAVYGWALARGRRNGAIVRLTS